MSKQSLDVEYVESGGDAERGRRLVAIVAAVAVVIAGVVGTILLLSDEARAPSSAPVERAADPAVAVVEGPLEVSGAGVGTQRFGTDADTVLAALGDRLGEPDVTVGPRRYARIPRSDGWFELADDPLSPSWQYPVTSVSCWGALCLMFGGDDAAGLRLRGWEVSEFRRWSGDEGPDGRQPPDVRLADSGVRLGDSWERLHEAYPETTVGGAEGASLSVQTTPWPGVFDGVAGWRLSGTWDYTHPNRAPAEASVTRLSGGEGPEPGCC